MERPAPGTGAGYLVSRGPDQHVATKPAEIRDDHAGAWPRYRVPQNQLRLGNLGMVSYPVRIVSDQLVQAEPGCFGCQLVGVVEPKLHSFGHRVAGASTDRVVEFALQQKPPGMIQQGTPIAAAAL